MKELIKKYYNETLEFEHLYKHHVKYSNNRITVFAILDYRSELYLNLTLGDIDVDCEITDVIEK